jgi:carboxyl-terminal processing protease
MKQKFVSSKHATTMNFIILLIIFLALQNYSIGNTPGNLVSAFGIPRWKQLISMPNKPQNIVTPFVATMLSLVTWASPLELQIQSSLSNPNLFLQISSRANALTEQQFLVADVWKEVTRQYVDRSFHGMGEENWKKKRLDTILKVANMGPDDTEQLYDAIRGMLQTLGDPYTRFLTPDQYEALTAYARGTASSTTAGGIGVQLIINPTSGRIAVLQTIPGGPAEIAGMLPGDEIRTINGENVETATAEVVAAKCRGPADTTVLLEIERAGIEKPTAISSISVTRTILATPKSVQYTVLRSKENTNVGLIRISSFTQETANQMDEALKAIQEQDISNLVLDLRGNSGGYMPAGVDLAQFFLMPGSRIMTELTATQGSSSSSSSSVLPTSSLSDKSRATIFVAQGVGGANPIGNSHGRSSSSSSDNEIPLYVLVDERTASASEIFVAALQDNHRAKIVGTTTFGKARIQNVQGPLTDGSGIAVTKAKYLTPNGRDIQGVGIMPDIERKEQCRLGKDIKLCLDGILF